MIIAHQERVAELGQFAIQSCGRLWNIDPWLYEVVGRNSSIARSDRLNLHACQLPLRK